MRSKLIISLILSALIFTCPAKEHRSKTPIRHFKKEHPCPSSDPVFHGATRGACPGYVVDHIWALACGGPDKEWNMQWQSRYEGYIKDRFELSLCGK